MPKKIEELPLEYREIKAVFKLVFYSALGIMACCLAVSIILPLQQTLTESGTTLFKSTLTIFQIGTGAVFGLLGGKVIPSNRI